MRCVRAWARAWSSSPAATNKGAPTVAGFNEHFTQRGLASADIFQTHGAHHFSLVAGHPKPAVAGLVKSPDILQIGLIGGIDSDAEFLLLDSRMMAVTACLSCSRYDLISIIYHPLARQLTLLAPSAAAPWGESAS